MEEKTHWTQTTQAKIDRIIKGALPLEYVKFHAAVNNAKKEPQDYFVAEGDVAPRRSDIWIGEGLVICRQIGIHGTPVFFGTGYATIKEFRVKHGEE